MTSDKTHTPSHRKTWEAFVQSATCFTLSKEQGITQISGHSSIDPKLHVERIYRGMPSPLIWATHAFTRSSDMSGWLSSSHARPAHAQSHNMSTLYGD